MNTYRIAVFVCKRPNFCKESIFLPSSNICWWLLYPVTKLCARDLLKSSRACNGVWSWTWGWILITIDSVIRGYHVYKRVIISYTGEVLQWHHARDSHNHRNTLAFWVRWQNKSVPLLRYLNRYRIKESQAWNCDTCSELKRKCKSNWRVKICKLAIARIIRTN